MESKLDLKFHSNLLDLINMYVGVYFDKYLGFEWFEYFKLSHNGFSSRLVLFDSRHHETIRKIAEKFDSLEKIDRRSDEVKDKDFIHSKFNFYFTIAIEIFNMKDFEATQFVELMLIRENLLKLTKRYNDLTGNQKDLVEYSNQKRISYFNVKLNYNKNISQKLNPEYDFVGYLENFELEDEIIVLVKSLDSKTVSNKIQKIDDLIMQFCPQVNFFIS